SDNLELKLAEIPVTLSGWTDFDGRLSYRVRSEELTRRLPREAKGILSDLSIDVSRLITLRVEGSLDHLSVTADGLPLTGDPTKRAEERAKFRELGRRLRDELLR